MPQSPLIRRILVFGVLSAVVSLLLAVAGFGIVEFYKIKGEAQNQLQSQALILAYNLQPTLIFNDKDAAEKIIHSLEEDRSLNSVKVYKVNGELFANFTRAIRPGDISIRKNIYYDRRLIGWLEIESVFIGIKERYQTYLLIALLIILFSIPAAFLISGPIRKQVSQAVAQLEQLTNRLRILADQVAATEQQERKRIAAIIHDHLQQILAASKIQLDMALKKISKKDYVNAAANLNRSDEFLDEAIRSAKSLTVELRPPVLYEAGLPAAFQWLANKFKNEHNLEVSLRLGEVPGRISDTLKIMIFESAKELLFNVVKYSGVPKAELSLSYDSNAIKLRVIDHGRGFDVSKLTRGTGFGLFSIRERLRLLNGDMRIKSHLNGGTEVELSIPMEMAIERPTERLPERAVAEKSKVNKGKNKAIQILLADDHKIVREGIATLLNEDPSLNVVAQAENGIEAIEKAERLLPDVVIMDINMPKLNGIEATRTIKRRFPQIDIIGLSVQDEHNVVLSMKEAGAVTLVNKGGDLQELVQTILSTRKNHRHNGS